MKKTLATLVCLGMFLGGTTAWAQPGGLIIEEEEIGKGGELIIIEEEGASLEALEKQVELMAEEIDGLRDDVSTFRRNVNVTGYGETHLRFPSDERRNNFDAHRFVIGINAKFNDWIFLNAEIDYEHAAQQLEFEMGYLDFLLDPKFNVRAGTVLIPVGFLNEFHEPVFFWTVERPLLQNRAIPTSWNGTGGGVFGTFGNVLGGMNYRVYVVNSLQSLRINASDNGSGVGAGGASGQFTSSGIRGGRLQPNNMIASDLAVTGRVELPNLFPGFQLGASFYTGDTSHNFIDAGARTTLVEGDIKFRKRWFEMNATVVHTHINNAAEINKANAIAPVAANATSTTVPTGSFAWNVQVGVHLLQLMKVATSHDIVLHGMYERIDSQNEIPAGFPRDVSQEVDVFTGGVAWFPTPNVAIKLDYTNQDRGNNTSSQEFNLGMAYMFF
ncbi:hypothetical protein LQ236_002837 [Nitrospina gracilis]|uniref:hypothetical protein n=2 Tax=Nitrospina TaxID=35800 RepID=UPI001F400D69|nr:hypothetical protein [Nitrospina sp. Nb-3]MCF8724817.1 hypothetical protein [Nitrospina sp. Nb-3]